MPNGSKNGKIPRVTTVTIVTQRRRLWLDGQFMVTGVLQRSLLVDSRGAPMLKRMMLPR